MKKFIYCELFSFVFLFCPCNCSNYRLPISRKQVYTLFSKYAEKAGLPPKKRFPHILKHTLGTELGDNGADEKYMQFRLGHKNINNTFVYTHLTRAKRELEDKRFAERMARKLGR